MTVVAVEIVEMIVTAGKVLVVVTVVLTTAVEVGCTGLKIVEVKVSGIAIMFVLVK